MHPKLGASKMNLRECELINKISLKHTFHYASQYYVFFLLFSYLCVVLVVGYRIALPLLAFIQEGNITHKTFANCDKGLQVDVASHPSQKG